MTIQNVLCSAGSRGTTITALGFLVAALLTHPAHAQEKEATIGKLQSKDGTLFSRAPELPLQRKNLRWKIYNQNDEVTAGKLYVGLPGAMVQSNSGNVNLLFGTDLNDKSPYPIFEAAIIPQDPGKLDFDVILDRGRIVLFHVGKEGPASVRVRFRDEVWEITLQEPGTVVGLETFGRWPQGSRFTPDPKSKAAPLQMTALLVVKGKITLKTPASRIAMNAPPGPAFYSWLSAFGRDRSPRFLKEIPEWANVDRSSDVVKKKLERLEMIRQLVVRLKNVNLVVAALLNSPDPEVRRRAPIAAGAFDTLDILAMVLHTTKDIEVWQTAVTAFRHWLGRGPGQDQLLYTLMTKGAGPLRRVPEAEAKTVIQLLHGFTEDDVKEPALYELLIRLLKDKRLGVRGLAAWHLHHLAPKVDIPFNPVGTEEEREKIHEAWKKAIPEGTIPTAKASEK